MLPPAFQSHLTQLATIGQQMHRMAAGLNMTAAVTAAREAITLLKSHDVQSALPSLDSRLRGIEIGLEEPNVSDLRRVISDLSRLIQSLGASHRPFLAIVQNAPDQRPQAKPNDQLQKTSVLGALERLWDRGEHDKARQLLEGIVLSAQEGDIRSRALLSDIVCSERPTVSINIRAVADVLDTVGWHEFTLRLIDPHHTLLIPGLHPSKINPHLISDLLSRPPAVPGIVDALSAVLRRKNVKDPWGLRTRAAQGLFSLTTPGRGETVSVFRFWEILIQSWPVAVPALRPEGFGPTKDAEHRWDLYEEHLKRAFEIIENQAQPRALREATLTALWAGGPARGPRNLCFVACSRTLDMAEKSPAWVWPIAAAPLEDLMRSGFVASERLESLLPRKKQDITLGKGAGQPVDPRKLIEELGLFAEEKSPHLRLISTEIIARSPNEILERLTAVAQELGSYGLILEPSLVAAAIKKAVEILPLFETLDAFRNALYPLHPAAAVTAWFETTGLPWPSNLLPGGHRPEAALALLRWLREREKEPVEIQTETARRYWEIDRRLLQRSWHSAAPKPLEWWHHRLAMELSATLAPQVLKANETGGSSHGWAEYARTYPEVTNDVRALAKSPLPGTRLLAGQIHSLLTLNHRP